MNRRKLAFIYLPIIAVIPVLLGVYQVTHFLDWLLELELDLVWMAHFCHFSYFILLLCFIISLYEHFCIYYRLVIAATLYASLSCHFADWFPSIYFYNITNIIAILIIFVGIIGCLVHFGIQIKDFIRYVRTKR